MFEKLKPLREAAGLSQEKLAAKAGVSRLTIAEMESGKANITTRTLKKVADALDVEVLEIWTPKS